MNPQNLHENVKRKQSPIQRQHQYRAKRQSKIMPNDKAKSCQMAKQNRAK